MKRAPGTTTPQRRAALIAMLMFWGAGLGWTAGPSGAQDVMRIAAIVNETVISVFDLETRINMALSSSKLQNDEEVRRRLAGPVLRNLIDEALQVQEAERQGIRVTDQDLTRAMAQIEENNGVESGGLPGYLAQLGIAMSTVESQIHAQIAWGKYINQRIRRRSISAKKKSTKSWRASRRIAAGRNIWCRKFRFISTRNLPRPMFWRPRAA